MAFYGKEKRYPGQKDVAKVKTLTKDAVKKLGFTEGVVTEDMIKCMLSWSQVVMSPSASVVGGIIAQQVIGLISGQGPPFSIIARLKFQENLSRTLLYLTETQWRP
jgi:hypothetical protein